nr:mandelate racemase/muconate lactonizing enzyme family protein [Halarchaeum acidiphilum]
MGGTVEHSVTDSKYHQLVAEMKGGIEWRDLSDGDMERDPSRSAKITDVTCHVVGGNFPWNVITVETDAGVTGVGEAFNGPISEHVEYLRPGLVGENPYDVERLEEHMTQLLSGLGGGVGYSQAAVSGIETALWDVVGKLTGLPVYQLLGGKFRDEVRIYCDCHAGEHLDAGSGKAFEAYDPEAYADAAADVVDEGFDALKFDLDVAAGDADTATRRLSNAAVQHKVDVVAAVRERIGDEPALAFDLHWNFTVETALRIARELEAYDLAWLEDPVPPENADAHRRVTEGTSTPILAGENLTRVETFLPYLTEGAMDVAAPDIQKCGGLAEFRRVAALADAVDVPVTPHNVSSPIGTVASVHACASVPNAFVLEWHARDVDWWDDLYEGAPLIEDGRITVPEGPGLGLDIDVDAYNERLAAGEEPIDL